MPLRKWGNVSVTSILDVVRERGAISLSRVNSLLPLRTCASKCIYPSYRRSIATAANSDAPFVQLSADSRKRSVPCSSRSGLSYVWQPSVPELDHTHFRRDVWVACLWWVVSVTDKPVAMLQIHVAWGLNPGVVVWVLFCGFSECRIVPVLNWRIMRVLVTDGKYFKTTLNTLSLRNVLICTRRNVWRFSKN